MARTLESRAIVVKDRGRNLLRHSMLAEKVAEQGLYERLRLWLIAEEEEMSRAGWEWEFKGIRV